RRHARIKRDWNGFLAEDVGSKNGVLVNDQLVKKSRRLKDRDELTIGPVKVVFIDPDADLLRALEDVDGFPKDEHEPEVNEGDPSVIGEPMGNEGTSGEEGPQVLEGEGTLGEAEEGEEGGADNLAEADIDPALLEHRPSRLPNEWIVIGLVSFLLLASITLILVILT
ncbi:MAG: FHA domain-containing protein, partial [Clostridia bacterium]|nr:FHA domain-containing protein [Deltaproteobacteria bacterium]